MKINKTLADELSNSFFEKVFNSSPIPSVILNIDTPNFSIIAANKAYLSLFRIAEDKLLDNGILKFLNTNTIAPNSSILLTSINNAIQTKSVDTIHTQPYNLNNPQELTPNYWQIEHKPILNAQRKVQFVIQNIFDKTEIVHCEKLLSAAETKTRFHFEHSAYPMIIWDFETRNILDVNEKAIELYGYSRAEFLQMNTTQIRPKEDVELLLEATKDVAHYGDKHHKIWRHQKKTGEIMYMEVSAILATINGRLVSITHNQDVTERLFAEKVLKASEEKYAALFMGASDAIFVADAETALITDANDQACKLTGKSKGEIIGMHQTSLHSPEDLEFISEQFKLFVSTDYYKTIETSVMHKDGNKVPVSISSSAPFKIGDRKYAVAYFHDLTRRKESENVIEKTTRLLQKAEEIAKIGSVDIDVETEERFYSQGFKKIIGLEEEKKVHFANDFLECVLPAYRQSHVNWLNNLGKSYDDTLSNEIKIKIKRKNDGQERILSIHGISIRNEHGKLTKRIGVIEDITERKQLEIDLIESHNQLKKLTDEVPLGIIQMEIAGNETPTIKFISRGIENIHTGLTPEEVTRNTALLFERIYPEDINLVIDSGNKSVDNLVNVDIEFRATDIGKELKWVRLAYHPERNEDGSTSLYGYFQDITKEKGMLQSLENQNKELKEIAWIQSHTVRAPLARLMGLANLLKRGKAKEMGMEDYFMENILTTCNELDIIIREIVEKANKMV